MLGAHRGCCFAVTWEKKRWSRKSSRPIDGRESSSFPSTAWLAAVFGENTHQRVHAYASTEHRRALSPFRLLISHSSITLPRTLASQPPSTDKQMLVKATVLSTLATLAVARSTAIRRGEIVACPSGPGETGNKEFVSHYVSYYPLVMQSQAG